MKHRETHPTLDVPGCFGCRISSVSFAPSAMPSRHAEAAAAKQTGKGWEKDLPAYKRLVDAGMQPRSTVGTHALEQSAALPIEVETGVVLTEKQRREYQSVTADLPSPPKVA